MWDAKKNSTKWPMLKGHDHWYSGSYRSCLHARAHRYPAPPSCDDSLLLSNSGREPSLEIFTIPSGIVSFVRKAVQAQTANGWRAVTERFLRCRKQSDDRKVLASVKPLRGLPLSQVGLGGARIRLSKICRVLKLALWTETPPTVVRRVCSRTG